MPSSPSGTELIQTFFTRKEAIMIVALARNYAKELARNYAKEVEGAPNDLVERCRSILIKLETNESANWTLWELERLFKPRSRGRDDEEVPF